MILLNEKLLGIELTKQDQVNEVPFCIEKSPFFCRPKKVYENLDQLNPGSTFVKTQMTYNRGTDLALVLG